MSKDEKQMNGHTELDVLPQDGEKDGDSKEQGEVWAAPVILFT